MANRAKFLFKVARVEKRSPGQGLEAAQRGGRQSEAEARYAGGLLRMRFADRGFWLHPRPAASQRFTIGRARPVSLPCAIRRNP